MPEEVDLSQYKDAFISESQETLENLNQSLLGLEKDPENQEFVNEIFRAVHSLKGMSATMGFERIAMLAQEMEDVLGKLRAGEVKASSNIVDILFECFDALENLIGEVTEGKEEKADYSPLLEELRGIKREAEEIGLLKKTKTPLVRRIQSVRISTERLDSLMNLAGEILISKNRLQNIANKYKIAELDETLSLFDRLTSDLEDEILETRLVPAEQTFNRFPRMVRDLAREEGKEIDLIMEGKEIELDRMMLDSLSDPLVHLLRNAIDHGIESPQEREGKNKRRAGGVKLAARREETQVIIEVGDDGKGMDPEEIRKIAVEKGIVSFEEASRLDEHDTMRLIFAPAFTTARKATEVSGRGVGLDVVRTTVESLGGSTEVKSKKEVGTRIFLKLPLTTAIIQALLVGLEDEVYALPLVDVVETLKINPEDIKTVQRQEVVSVRGEVVPLIRLGKVLGIPLKGDNTKSFPSVIVRKGERHVSLALDSLIGKQEIVVKPLDPLLRKAGGFAGATILGDGRVVLILDISTLIL
jgi:two-component system chemotaxis sensor kinase CheA